MEKVDALKKYKRLLKLGGKSKWTINTYINVLERLFDYCKGDVDDITEEDVNDFLLYLKEEKGLDGRSLATYRASIKSFSDLMSLQLDFKMIPKSKHSGRRVPKIITKEEVRKLVKRAKTLQFKCIVSLSYDGLLRVGETIGLKVNNVDLKRRELMVANPEKGGTPCIIKIRKETQELLKKYIKRNHLKTDDLLFPSRLGKSFKANTISSRFRILADKLEMSKDISFHTLRHSRATHLLRAGVDFFKVHKMTRHVDIRNTTIYLHLVPEEIAEEELEI